MFAKERLQVRPASSWKANVLSQVFRAGDHPRRQRGGEAHALLLVELGVLEGGEPLDLVQEGRGQAGLLDEETLGEDTAHPLWKRLRDVDLARPARWRACPRLGLFLIGWFRPANADHRTLPRRLTCDSLDSLSVDSGHGSQVDPLLFARQGLELIVEEHRIPLFPRPALEGQCDEVAEAPSRHGVLAPREARQGGSAPPLAHLRDGREAPQPSRSLGSARPCVARALPAGCHQADGCTSTAWQAGSLDTIA